MKSNNLIPLINIQQLHGILENHKRFINGDGEQFRADLSYKNLTGLDLSEVNLSYSKMTGVNLTQAKLIKANLRFADLSLSNLYKANLRNTDLQHTNLCFADLSFADLTDIKLDNSNLEGCNIDFSCLSLNYDNLYAHFDDKHIEQFLYRVLSIVEKSKNVNDEIKKALLTNENIAIANRFNHTHAFCNKITQI